MKGKSIIEVLLVFTITTFITWVLRLVLGDLIRLEIETLGWSYIGGTISVLITLFVMFLTKMDFETYGITKKKWKYNLDVGLTCYLVLPIPIVFLLVFNLNYVEIIGGLILAVSFIIALLLILLILQYREKKSDEPREVNIRANLILLSILLFLPILIGILLHKPTSVILKVVSTVIWQFVFSGFGEELRYRGYYQSRINNEFGRPYKFLGVEFGPGLIIASLLFGITHALNTFSPFEGIYEIAWGWGFFTIFGGAFFGFIKEKTNSIIAPGIAHGSDAIGESFRILFS